MKASSYRIQDESGTRYIVTKSGLSISRATDDGEGGDYRYQGLITPAVRADLNVPMYAEIDLNYPGHVICHYWAETPNGDYRELISY